MVLRKISKQDVHNITSGQVITELDSIVKELLDNAIDAGANTITINFKRYGLEGIEIQDNGNGIKSEDFTNICLKNYTSKLENFQNLATVSTLGFRGEALNSLCNMSTVTITTATESEAPKGWELKFNKSGELTGKRMVNQSKGTCISVSDIFEDLPVRKRNLEKNYKKEFQKCIGTLTAYMLILKDIRIIVSNIDVMGKKRLVLKTSGNKKVKDNVINVFGSSGLQGLREIDFTLPLDDTYCLHISGLVSSASIGDGRLSRDRQYIYINGRPVDYKPLIKHITESYKKVNFMQNPVIILNLKIPEAILDVNVTPDKRTVLISKRYENLIIENILTSLESFWDSTDYTIPVNSDYQERINERNALSEPLVQISLDAFAFSQDQSSQVSLPPKSEGDIKDCTNDLLFEREVCLEKGPKLVASHEGSSLADLGVQKDILETNYRDKFETTDNDLDLNAVASRDSKEEPDSTHSQVDVSNCTVILEKNATQSSFSNSCDVDEVLSEQNCNTNTELGELKNVIGNYSSEHDDSFRREFLAESLTVPEMPAFSTTEILSDLNNENICDELKQPKRIHKIRIQDSDLKSNIKRQKLPLYPKTLAHPVESVDFMDKDVSEKMLTLSINKDDFLHLGIIGQFNKGFIIVHKKDTDDILIVDQHASDEKFNFEKLINETTFENQPLVVPQKLEINSIEKLTILNNLDIFEKNGFKFKTQFSDSDHSDNETDEDNHLGGKEIIFLTSLPYSKNTIFNMKDMDELLQLITERSNFTSLPRPTKVRSMFAMRACRSSIMIGQTLNTAKMEKVVQNLSTLDKPWNCPHGRPTMRHIAKIDQWQSFTDDYCV